MTDHGHDVAAWALDYLGRGWQPIAYAAGVKGPREKDWPSKRYTAEEIPAAFGPGNNLGLLLGPASGGLADADFDDPLALACALHFLPATACSFGRPSKPRSHAFYICSDMPSEGASRKFVDPEHGCLLELRAQSGQQTMVPPSMHPDGERCTWRRDEGPARVPYSELCKAMCRSAAAALIAHRLGGGNRHGQMLLVAGALLRSMPKASALPILEAAYHASGGRDWPDALRAIDDTAERIARGERATGKPKLAEEWGSKAAALLFEWLGVSATAATPAPRGKLTGRTGLDVHLTRFEWVWPGYVLRRSLNELVGDAGLGKSSALADLAARVTAGLPWPDGAVNDLGPRNVVILSAEDEFSSVILPRALAAGADRGRVVECPGMVSFDGDAPDEVFTLGMRDALDDFLGHWKPALMIVDPLNSFIGGDIKAVEATKVRPRLEGIRPLLQKHDVAFLWIRHERKGDAGGKLTHKGSGIADITAVARSSLLAFADPDDEELRYIAPAKSNLAKRAATLPYRIGNVESLDGAVDGDVQVRNIARIEWQAPDERSAAQILSAKKSTRDGTECTLWLHEQLAKGPRSVAEVHEAGRDRFARTLIDRTVRSIGVVREGRGDRATWRMPF